MLKNITIKNFKSIDNLSIELGRFNVFIGENGCGKSNILESIVFASAAFNGNIENEFLALRGARISEPALMRSGFETANLSEEINVSLKDSKGQDHNLTFTNDNQPFSKWKFALYASRDTQIFNDKTFNHGEIDLDAVLEELILKYNEATAADPAKKVIDRLKDLKAAIGTNKISLSNSPANISDYMIFAPENFFLRNLSLNETYVEPVGYRGEGLLKLIKVIKKEKTEHYKTIVENLSLIDWFSSFDVKEDFTGEVEFFLSDKYLEDGLKSFDIRNANEGFLFLLFYITLFTSDYTPSFFAIDNIDTALNPKLCSKLISVLAELSVKHNKQVILTTHNPSVLDGLNLNNDDERLFVISRNAVGNTRANRILKKPSIEGEPSLKLSEQFIRGYIGGLPKSF